MAFMTANQYEEKKYNGKFRLANDGDVAEVIPLYRNKSDVLIADVHYINSSEYAGYVHCCGRGCPACSRGIRRQTKLFVPLYNITAHEIQFWDRNQKFLPQVHSDIFAHDKFPNPSEFVYRITRHGAAGDMNTRYEIMAIGKNSGMPYDKILADNNATFPDYYSVICKDADAATISLWINSGNANSGSAYDSSSMPDYVPTPRAYAPSTSNAPVSSDIEKFASQNEFDYELTDEDAPF